MSAMVPLHVGTNRQLFLDNLWVAESQGVTRRLHEPVRREAAITSEHPWEQGLFTFNVVFRDGQRYRMYYRTRDRLKYRASGPVGLTAYAESSDGIHWEKPRLRLLEFQGSKDNNLVWMGPGFMMSPFLDSNPNAPDDERYKGVVVRGYSRFYFSDVDLTGPDTDSLLGVASPDGINWRVIQQGPVLTEGPFDTLNVPFWDEWRGEYVIYTRGVKGTKWDGVFDGGVRWIRRATSTDFRHWTALEDIDTGKAPLEHLYTNACVQYQRAPGTYLMFPSRFLPERKPDPEWPAPGVNDIVFMSSRDGLHFDRSFLQAYLRPGLDRGNWHERALYMERGLLQTSPEEMSMFVTENGKLPSVNIRRYTVRTDGFVSVNAGYGGGEFTTRPLMFEGRELELNYSTSAVGYVRVEVQDAAGQAQSGFALDASPEIFGDEIEGVVRWENGSDLGPLAGKPVRLRFALKDADLFAFRFR